MSIEYRLIPPFLHAPEASSFPAAWEQFCCKLLNLEHRTNEIIVRSPPEQGVDLFYPSSGIAYQCKSVESGKPGDFNQTHAVSSYQAALKHRTAIGWKSYVLCTNVDVTGSALANLKAAIPGISVLSAAHWRHQCEQHASAVARNFRTLIEVQPRHIAYGGSQSDVAAIFGDEPTQIDAKAFTILLYSNRHDAVYRLPVRADMTLGQLLASLRELFKLPGQETFSNENVSISLSHSLVVNERQVPLAQTLAEAGIGANAIVTYWTKFVWRDLDDGRQFDGNVIHFQTLGGFERKQSRKKRLGAALAAYGAIVKRRFESVDRELGA